MKGLFSEVHLTHILGPGDVGYSVAYKIGGDHNLLERGRTAPAYQRAGAEEDGRRLARAEGRWYREGYDIDNGLLLVHGEGRGEERARKAARANRRRSRVYRGVARTVGGSERDVNQ